MVAHSLKVSACRTRSIHETLELDGCNNIGRLVISIFAVLIEVDDVKTRSYDDSTVLNCNDLVFLLVINSLGRTDLCADTALTCLEVTAPISGTA